MGGGVDTSDGDMTKESCEIEEGVSEGAVLDDTFNSGVNISTVSGTL